MVRWERFLPHMALRVLLVEADDSTRQIVAALLRKCSYKVAAVPDGLKAWEVLKGRPHNVDLILTEVELPSISGFALLTLIMEHETCKSIPVIMMSWHDSITTVYKCMLRGAADFLVKPIRRNELKNLWQHVWRRQCSTVCKSSPQDESGAQKKVEATAENNATSNHSSGYKACVQMNKECIEKGSDAQSSCTKPDLEAEKTYMESMQDLSESKQPFQKSDEAVKSGQESFIQENEAGGSVVASVKEANKVFWNKDVEQERGRQDLNDPGQACDNNDVLLNSSKEAIDLIGAFDNNLRSGYRVSGSNIIQNKLDSFSLLDLSLRRSHPGGPENQITDEKQMLNHSNASAFSRYVNRASHPLRPVPGNACDQRTEYGANSDKNLSSCVLGYNSDASVSTRNVQRNIISMVNGRFEQSEGVLSCPQDGVIPASVPLGGVKFDSFCAAGFGPVRPPLFRTQSGPSPVQNPSSASYHEGSMLLNKHQSRAETNRSKQLFEPFAQNANNLSDQMRPEEDHKVVSLDDQGHFSTSTDQGATSRFCNGNAIQLNSISMCGSNGPSNPVALVRTGSEGANEDGLSAYDGNSYRYTQREAALNKFRLKRKDRCFEKKVRYESRKKLAEQRPRIKGQFVRQTYADAPPPEIEHS